MLSKKDESFISGHFCVGLAVERFVLPNEALGIKSVKG